MICDRCGTDTVAWVGDLLNPTGTKCSRCGGTNCQRAELPDEEIEDEVAPDCPVCGDTQVITKAVETRMPGSAVTYPDEIDVPCPSCCGPDPDYQRDLMMERRALEKEFPDAE